LHRDEFLHLDQGHHIAWGFVSVPPLTSWFAWIIFRLGGGEFWVKFFPALFGALTMVFTWKIVEELKGKLFACLLATTAVMLSAILRLNTLFQPNSFDVLSWTLVYYFLVCFINRKDNRFLYCVALAAGFGFLNKYSIVFLLAGLFFALLASPERQLFWRRQTLLSILIGVVIILPNIAWQVQHGWPVIHHMKELTDTQLVNVNRGDFLKEQLLFFLGCCWIFFFTAYGLARNPELKPFRWIGYSYMVTLSLFLYLQAKGYYAIGLYPVLLAVGSVQVEKMLSVGRWKYLRPVLYVSLIALFIPFIKFAFPVLTPEEIHANDSLYRKLGLLRWEDGKDHTLPQDFADMVGWKELAQKVDSNYAMLKATGYTLVLTDNYGQAGAINYYSKTPGLHAVSMNADYINWIPYDMDIRNVILVQESTDDDPGRTRERSFFRSVTFGGELLNPWAREKGTKIYNCIDASQSIGSILKEEAAERTW
ncbi:MAG TPA: glycosyltransferase family 39 protein, partial [Flavitalea sp.]|nr:glycosyltransferase family 39 protein [Flavitalea sp.]